MTLHLRTDDAWRRIRELAQKKGRKLVAVSFLSAGAAERLALGAGDLLVTRFDDAAIGSGQVDPREVVKYLRRNVEVHAVGNLHAKVFVLGKNAVVGSTNVSTLSEHHLVEATCESNSPAFVGACRRFVESLCGDVVSLQFAKSKVPQYKPPKPFVGGRKHPPEPKHSALGAVLIKPIDFDEVDDRELPEGRARARTRLVNEERFAIDEFRWVGSLPGWLRRDARVLACNKNGRRSTVAHPARVLDVRKYRSKRGHSRALVFLERPKRLREKKLSIVVRQVPEAKMLRRVKGSRLLNAAVARHICALWIRRGREDRESRA